MKDKAVPFLPSIHQFLTGRFSPAYFPLILWLAAAPWLLFPQLNASLSTLALLAVIGVTGHTWRWGRRLPVTGLNPVILTCLALYALAFAISPLPEISLPKATTLFLGVTGYFLCRPLLIRPGDQHKLIMALTAAGGIIATAGLFTLQWPARQIVDLQAITGRLPHLSGSFYINVNEMAGTLAFLSPFALAAARQEKKGRLFWLIWAAPLLMLFMLLLTQSRGAFLALALALPAWRLWGRRPLRPVLAAALALTLLAGGAILLAGLTPADLSHWLVAIDAGSKQGPVEAVSWNGRLEIWQTAVLMLRDYPLTGAGLYLFEPVSRANYVYHFFDTDFPLTHAHNLWLQAGATMGWAGLAAQAGLWAVVLYGLWQTAVRQTGQKQALARLYSAAILIYLLFNSYDTISPGQKPGLLIWLILAGAAAIMDTKGKHEQPLLKKAALVAAGLPPLLMLALALTPAGSRNLDNLALDRARLNNTPLHTEITTISFEGDTRRQALLATLRDDQVTALALWQQTPDAAAFLTAQGQLAAADKALEEAFAWYDLALTIEPTAATSYFWRGAAHETAGRQLQARADYTAAARYAATAGLSPNWQAWILYTLGRTQAQAALWPDAVDSFHQALALDNQKGLYYQALGDALIALGDETGAAQAYAEAKKR